MHLRRQTYDQLRILNLIHSSGAPEPLSNADIATKLGMSLQQTTKLTHWLRREGLVSTVRGPGGGIVLVDDVPNTGLGTLVESLEAAEPLQGGEVVGSEDVALDEHLQAGFRSMKAKLNSRTLKDLHPLRSRRR